MILDSTNDKQHENTDATPDSDTQATADSATTNKSHKSTDWGSLRLSQTAADSAATNEPASDAATIEASEAAALTEAADPGEDRTPAGEAAAETADEVEADEAAETNAATVSSATAAPRASLPTKAVAAVLMLAFVGAAFLFIQRSSSKPVSYNLTKHDMEVIFQEMIPPQQQAQMAASPEDKKKLIDEVRKLMSVAAYAESEGYAQRPEVQAQLALQTDLGLNEAYRKKNPDVQVNDDEINAYYQAHPKEFDTFLQNNPRFQQQASGPNRDNLKKEYGKLKVIAERARKEKFDEADDVRLEMLIKRSDILNNAYLSDLDKDPNLVSDAEIEQYYREHQGDFEQVHVRHILISTQPQQPPSPDAAKKGEQPKAPSKEEARKKAEEVLAKARKGEDFAALAKQYSDDPRSKDKGGELPPFSHGAMVPEFDKAAFALQPGAISDHLIETQFGYHIIKLEEHRQDPGASDPKIRQQIVNKLKKDKIDAKIDEIAKNSKVTVPEDFDMNVKAAEPPQLPTGHPTVPSDKQ